MNIKKLNIPISNNTGPGSLIKLFPELNECSENDTFNYKHNVLLSTLTPRFNSIYNKYTNSKKKQFFPDVMTLLSDYKNEKLKNFRETDSMKEEIDEEIKKYKLVHEMLKRKTNIDQKYFSYGKSIKKKVKENKFNLLQTFKVFAKDGKITSRKKWKNIYETIVPKSISARSMFKSKDDLKNKTYDASRKKSIIYTKRRNLIDFLELKEKDELKKKNGVNHAWVFGQQKINIVCDDIIEDSKIARQEGKERLNRFNKTWTKYKKLKEFRYPDIQKKKEIVHSSYVY